LNPEEVKIETSNLINLDSINVNTSI